jgi:hypothetical protein
MQRPRALRLEVRGPWSCAHVRAVLECANRIDTPGMLDATITHAANLSVSRELIGSPST